MGWALANSAFAYAAAMTTSTSDIRNFFDLVVTRYNSFYSSGYLDYSSLVRVLDVLAHHCLGPWNVCAPTYTGHMLPGSHYGSIFSTKVQFREAESQNAPASYTIVGSSNASASSYLRVSGTPVSTIISYTISTASDPLNANLKIVARGGTFPTKTEYSVNGGPFVVANAPFAGAGSTWNWITIGTVVPTAGATQIRFRFSSAGANYDFDIDAVEIDASFGRRNCACAEGQPAGACP